MVHYFPKERITIAITGNVEDGGWGPEFISQRVANFYIPGAYLGGIKTSTDPDPKLTDQLRQLLQDIGKKQPENLRICLRLLMPRVSPRTSANKPRQICKT